MIAKVTRGTDGGGLVRYLFGPGRADEHVDQRAIAVGEGMDVRLGVALSDSETADLAGQLEAVKNLYGVEVNGGHIWHLSLTNPAGDRELSDEEWAGVAREAMDRLGFTSASGKAPAPWVAVRHGRSASGNDHVHIAVSLVREDGTKASIWQDRVILSRLCADMEQSLGLTVVDGRQRGGLPAPLRPEIEASARRGRIETERLTLARTVRAAAVASRSEAEFVRRLRSGGVLARPRYATGGTSEVVGYSVAMRPAAEGGQVVWFGGGKLGKDLVLPALRTAWDRSGEAQAEALEEWRARSSGRSGAEKVVLGPAGWRQAAERVSRATDALSRVPTNDRARWASAAREASGVFGSWAGRIEAVAPGAISKAADTLAWSAQARSPYEREPSVIDFRGVAAVAAQAAITTETAAGWVLLMEQMIRTIEVIQRAHEQRGEALQAARLARLVTAELTQRHREFERTAAAARASGARTAPSVLDPRLRPPGPGHDKGFGR